jgi:hypothetical protein
MICISLRPAPHTGGPRSPPSFIASLLLTVMRPIEQRKAMCGAQCIDRSTLHGRYIAHARPARAPGRERGALRPAVFLDPLLWSFGTISRAVDLAPREHSDCIDFFAIRSFDETHAALAMHQITGRSQSVLLRSKGSCDSVSVQARVKVMRCPGHA